MSRRPLVSITVPCYNAGSLLGWALASVVAQTYSNWECIVVDDGSQDRPDEIVASLGDSRIRLISFERNQGRAAARQAALDAASGEYLAKLDADDWLYPEKLERQVEVMERHAELGLLSSGIAIVDEEQTLAGIRARGAHEDCAPAGPLQRLQSLPLAHAASMIRMRAAKLKQYDRRLRRSEDSDYLLKVLFENRFCVTHDVLYAYREYRSAGRDAALDAYSNRITMFWNYRSRYPIAAVRLVAESVVKREVYRVAYATGRAHRLIQRRSVAPTHEDRRRHASAEQAVALVYARYFDKVDSRVLQRNEAAT